MRDSPHPVTIKTSPPSLEGVIERHRLIDALARLPAPAKWLQAPSGTGKSTLAASYARSRKKPLVWYRLDERDNDPAFFYLEFARTIGVKRPLPPSFPHFSSDDHARQGDFARRFASALGEQIEGPAVIVLDDVQRLTNAAQQRSLAAMTVAAGSEIEVLFVSESTAPTAFFDAIAARQLALLNDADLRFDVEECKEMSASLRIDEAQIESIAAVTGGHAGALVLACELLRGTDPKSALGAATVERIHSHLLTKLVERMAQPRRELLQLTAFVTQLTRPIAEALAGLGAARELDALVDSGLLRRVGAGKTEVFESHGLIRQGMQALIRANRSESETRALAERTATVLTDNDQPEAAFALLAEQGSTTRAIGVLEQLAERYAAAGQADLVMSLLAKLPQAEVQSNPWLCFWTGQALLQVDEERARDWLARAYSAFERGGDMSGMRLTAASIVTAFGLETGDLRDLDTWIRRHSSAGGDAPIEAGTQFETSLIMGTVCAAFFRGCYPPQIKSDALIARMRLLLDARPAWLSDDQRVQAARILIEHAMFFGTYEQARSLVIATRSLVDDAMGGALHRGRLLIAAAYAHFKDGDAARSILFLDEATKLAERSDSPRLFFELRFALADHWMKAQDFQRAAEQLSLLEPVAVRSAPAQRAEYGRMMARLLLLQGRLPEGLRWAEDALRTALLAGHSGASLRVFAIDLVYALTANDRIAEALDIISQQDFEPREVRVAIESCLRFLFESGSNLEWLRTGLRNAAQIGFFNLLDQARAPLVTICEAALDNNIETEFVLRLIAIKQLTPPPLAGARWPWPIKVRTLGGFRLEISGESYRPLHKAQDKPLELLKLLVTCQALGRDAAEKTWIEERLWANADPAKARKSLDMTLGRLRKLLGSEEAILSNEGRLQLSPTYVWTDIKTLRRALSHARTQRDQHVAGKPASLSDAAATIAAVLEHVGGPYLPDEDAAPWLLAGKEAVAGAVRHALVTADALLDGRADATLIPSLERALIADPTSEDLARSLMRAHLRHGHHSEALRVYRRLREMLSLLLGVAPSRQTDEIRDQARTGAPLTVHQSESVAGLQPLTAVTPTENSHGNTTNNQS